MAHTPGPWHVGSTVNTKYTIYDKHGQRVANAFEGVFSGHFSDKDCELHARLIAAAPDLVFQLLAAANYIDALGGDSKTYRAAIAKATGKK